MCALCIFAGIIKVMRPLLKTILLLTTFSVAMGFLESAVVIYLRALYYPHGFQFPLQPIPAQVAVVEFLREAATIIMLAIIGVLAGKNTAQRFSFFLFCFAVWDIFYYVFLKLFLDWPESFLTDDILFVIPVPWVGPVIAPCIVSLTMIVLTIIVAYFHQREIHVTIGLAEWLFFISGSFVLIISFTWDYMEYIFRNADTSVWTPMSENGLFSEVSQYIPQTFNWVVFGIGELLILVGMMIMIRRHKKLSPGPR